MKIDCLNDGYVRYINHMGADVDIVNSARVSYGKEVVELSDKDKRLIAFCWNAPHPSVFRHCVLSLEVRAPLMIARQWYKHAVASAHWDSQNGWNENSRRYVTEEPAFYIPANGEWRMKPVNSKQGSGDPLPDVIGNTYTTDLINYINNGIRLYEEAMTDGVAPEMARLFLPAYGMYVNWRWTTSLDGLINFMRLRQAADAQREFDEYTDAVITILKDKFPLIGQIIEDGNA